jgi:urate oxidase
MEDFARELIDYLLDNHSQISNVNIRVDSTAWSHMVTSNTACHPTSFIQSSNELQTTTAKRSRHGPLSIVSGLKDLKVMKTAYSGFAQFYKDRLTTLPETTDRLFGTAIQVQWAYNSASLTMDFNKMRTQIRTLILDMFADHHSLSVQHTLHAIGQYIFDNVKSVDRIHMTMPNIHCLPVDLTRFGEENRNEIFMPVDDPHGYIQCSLTRASTSKPVLQSKL